MLSSSVCFNLIAFVFGLCISENNGYSLPSYIKACYGLDTACLTKVANDVNEKFCSGIPELEVGPLDPFPVDELKVDLGGLDVNFGPGTLTGLKKCHIDKLAVKLDTQKIHLLATCNVTVKGKYKTKGQLLLFSLDGDGDAKIKIKKIQIKTTVDFVFEERDGETYMKHTNYTHSSQVLESAHFDLTNLLGGNKELSTVILDFINLNWRELYGQFSNPIIDKAVGLVVKNVANFMGKFPRQVLTPGFEELYKGKYL